MKVRNDDPHAYVNRGGGGCADCGRPPEHSIHTYTLPGFEPLVSLQEREEGQAVQPTLF